MQLVFEELIEKAREKEEKEARKRQRLADDFKNLLLSTKVCQCLLSYKLLLVMMLSLMVDMIIGWHCLILFIWGLIFFTI